MSSHPNQSSGASGGAPSEEVFIARQPILDADLNLYAYELLFRGSWENRFNPADAGFASYHTLNNAIHLFGLSSLTHGHPAFINFDRRALLDDAFMLLPPKLTVVEILEDVEPDDAVLAACRRLKEAGYTLAMDDCIFAERHNRLWSVVDVVKIDFMQSTRQERRDLARLCRDRGVISVAEKVETREDFDEAKEDGYRYFQGFFFCVPEMHRARDLRATQTVYLQFLRELNAPEPDYRKLEQAVKQDASLSYKLLRYLNSAAMGLRQRVTSIHQALVLLGIRPLRKWGSLVALTGLAEGEPKELLTRCLSRAHFCERIGHSLGAQEPFDSLFVTGLFSGLPAILHRSMAEVLEDVAVANEVRKALLGEDTQLGRVYALVRECELARWDRVADLMRNMQLDAACVARIQREAALWADTILRAPGSAA